MVETDGAERSDSMVSVVPAAQKNRLVVNRDKTTGDNRQDEIASGRWRGKLEAFPSPTAARQFLASVGPASLARRRNTRRTDVKRS